MKRLLDGISGCVQISNFADCIVWARCWKVKDVVQLRCHLEAVIHLVQVEGPAVVTDLRWLSLRAGSYSKCNILYCDLI